MAFCLHEEDVEVVDLNSSGDSIESNMPFLRSGRTKTVTRNVTTRRLSIVDLTNDSRQNITDYNLMSCEEVLNNSTETSTQGSKVNYINNRKLSLAGDIENTLTRFSCSICLDLWPSNGTSATICGHVYCTDCIVKVLKVTHKCPNCNKKLKQTDLMKLFF